MSAAAFCCGLILWGSFNFFAMKLYTYFIGSLNLSVETNFSVHFTGSDLNFFRPALAGKKNVSVRIDKMAELPAAPLYSLKTERFRVWESDGIEYRLYTNAATGNYFALSRFYRDRDYIIVSVCPAHEYREFVIWSYCHLEELLLDNQAIVLHSASIVYRGKAILFSAPSGTGKTTHSDLWREYVPGVSDINGDRTLLQLYENTWYACGFPASGSSVYCKQAAVPIYAIVVLRQASYNRVTELTNAQKMICLYSESTVFSENPENVSKAMDLLENLIGRVRVLMLECTPEKSAVDILYNYLYRR